MRTPKFGLIVFCSLFFFFNTKISFAQAPEVAAFAFQPTCVDGVVQSNGYLQISETDIGDAYHWSLGSTFNGGANTYANATSLAGATFPVQFGAFANPNVSQDYTVRVYNGSNTVFTDVVVTMNEQDCIVGCNCEEYVYLNEPNGGGGFSDKIHKYLVNSNGTFTETGNPWFDNDAAGETVTFPHGVTIDANGFVYIGEEANGGEIRKFSCDGTIHPTAGNGGFSIDHNGQTNLASIGTTLYANHWDGGGTPDRDGITAYDLCDGSYIGEVDFCDAPDGNNRDWGFYIDQLTGTMYSTTSFNSSTFPNHIYVYDESDFDTNPATCINPTTLSNLPTNATLAGITTDPSGNLYIVIKSDFSLPGDPSYILKYGPGPSYPFISSSAMDAIDDGTGWNEAIGIIYSEVTGNLFVSTTATMDDCIAVFDTDLNYLSQAVPAPGTGETGKGIALTKECCPTNNNQVVDISVCGEIGDKFLLSELINCDGAICESEWTPDPGNTGLDYLACDNSITVTSTTNTTGTFTLASDGTSAAAQCGAFSIVVNLTIECVDFGDLPDTGAGTGTLNYETLTAFSGPSHVIIPGLSIGSTVDADLDGQASSDALGDGADEDGFSFPAILGYVPGGTINLPIDVTNTTGTVAHYEIWIDWNGDGDFNDPNEMVADLSDNGAGNFGQNSVTINIPSNVVQDQPLGFRARLSNTDNMTPLGDVNSGEVEDYLISFAQAPEVAAFAFQPSCVDGVVQSNGYLQISETDTGDAYHWSLGSTFNGGANTYANATSLAGATFPVQFGAFANPNVSQDYTVRVYNGSNTVFTDVVVTMNEQDCISGCNCEEYVYLNEPDFIGTNDRVHKYLINADGTFTETGNPWFDNAAAGETVSFPHGITIDANGFIYVGEEANAGDIRKFSCDGTIHPTAANGGFSITHNGQTNLAAQGTTLYTNHWVSNVAPDYDGITAYDLCDGSYIGEVEFCDTQGANSRDWGFHIDPLTGTMYSTFSFVENPPNHIYVYDESDFDTDPTTCISPTPLSNLPTNAKIAGITTDPSGNLYIVIQEDFNLPDNPSYIQKYGPGPSYTYIGSSAMDGLDDGTGWNRAIGILYSEVTGDLFVSTTALMDDCIAVFDTDLNYLSQAVPAPGGGANGKGIALTKECCPTNNNQVVDISVCGEIGDQFLLSELINCDGAICESEWAPDPSNIGLDYIACDNSIVVTSTTNTCGTFTLESDGTSAVAQCGAFSIVVNLCVQCVDFGDLPDTGAGTGTLNYETLNAFSGPSHIIIPGLTIGSTVDADLDGQASFDALGDGADEDGFNFPANLDYVPGGTINLPIDVINTTGTVAHYEIWIDWNGDGDFNDANEMVADLSDDGAGNFGQNAMTINIPANATQDQTLGFRARLSHTDNMTPIDEVASGEVEDYLITVSCNPQICLPIGIIRN